MKKQSRFLSGDFSLKRVLILVAVTELILAACLYIYYDHYRDEFFPYPINADGTITVTGAPLLVGYGEAVPAPWTFSAVGSDTLRLNGLPFLPMREKDPTADMAPGVRDRMLTIKSILAEAEKAYRQTGDKAAGMEAFDGVLESYLGIFVSSVVVDRNGEQITVDFVDDLPPFTVTFLKDPHWIEPEGLRKKQQLDMIKNFIIWMQGNDADAVFSFGPYHTDLTVGHDTRREYTTVLSQLDHLASSSLDGLSEDTVRRTLGDADYDRWQGLIQDYMSWRGLHTAQVH